MRVGSEMGTGRTVEACAALGGPNIWNMLFATGGSAGTAAWTARVSSGAHLASTVVGCKMGTAIDGPAVISGGSNGFTVAAESAVRGPNMFNTSGAPDAKRLEAPVFCAVPGGVWRKCFEENLSGKP